MKHEDNQEVIELLHCPRGGGKCVEQRKSMNEYLISARDFFASKDYSRGLLVLKSAYMTTFNLDNDPCVKCADLFRNHIIESCEEKVNELKRMSTGLFKRKKFIPELEAASVLLKEMKNESK